MASIDNRVVSISFDNKAFEKNVEQTIRTLETLKTKLNFENAASSLSNINKASQAVDLSGIARAVDSISNKFSAMGAIAFSILDNLVTKAMSVGQNLVSTFSFSPVVGGFREYETNMNSIQTILANTSSKGTGLKEVNAALDELNQYADQTIYNFAEMARNIGTFTAAGVDLDTSTQAIKGIANLAAVSGSSSQQASVAMYQLSQAIASGTVRLIDWNSVQNAGMGGEVFQRALFETGKTLGTIANTPIDTTFEQWTSAGNTFRGSLEEGWLTSEVLTQTLQGFTGDLTEAQLLSMGYTQAQAEEILKMGVIAQDAATKVKTLTQLIDTTQEAIGSGWAQSFRILIGDFESARNLFTGLSDTIGEFVNRSAESRNELLQNFVDLGGRTVLIQGFTNAFTALAAVFRPIRDAFRTLFPKKTAEDLLAIAKGFERFTRSLIPSGRTLTLLKQIFLGIFTVFKIGVEIIKGVFSLFKNLFGLFAGSASSGILLFFAQIARGITAFGNVLLSEGRISGFFNSIFNSIQNFISKLKIQPVLDKLNDFRNAILGLFGGGSGENSPGGSAEETISIFERLENILKRIGNFAILVGEAFKSAFNGATTIVGGLASGIASVFTTIFGVIKKSASKISEVLGNMFDGLSDLFSGQNVDRATRGLAIGLGAGLLAIIKGFLNNGLAGLIGGRDLVKSLSQVFGSLEGVLSALQTNIKADAILRIAKALALLTASIIVLSLVDPVRLGTGLSALALGLGAMTAALYSVTKMAITPKQTSQLITFSIAVGVLSGAMILLSISARLLASADLPNLSVGLAGLIGFLLTLSKTAAKLTANIKGIIGAGVAIGFLGAGFLVLALAIRVLSFIDYENIVYGLGIIGVALSGILASSRLMKKDADFVNIGAGLILIAGSLLILALAIRILSLMSFETIGKGIGTIGVALAAIGGALRTFPEGEITKIGLTLLAVGVSLIFMAEAIRRISTLSYGEIARGLVGFAGVFILLNLALQGLEKDGLTKGIALFLIITSLNKLVDVLGNLGELPLTKIAKGLFAIIGVFAVIGLAGFIAEKIAFGLAVLGGTVLALGAGFALAGIGVKFFAEGLETLVKTGAAGLKFFASNVDDILALAPKFAQFIAKALYSFIIAFIDGVPEILKVLGSVFDKVLDLIISLLPKFTTTALMLIDSLVRVIREKVPLLIETGYEILLAFLSGLADNIGDIVENATTIVSEFLSTLAENLPDVIEAGIGLILAYIDGLIKAIPEIAPAVTELITTFLGELGKNAILIIAAGGQLIGDIITGIGQASLKIIEAGAKAIIDFLQGISDNLLLVIEMGFQIVIEFLNGVADSIRRNRGLLLAAGFNILDAIFGGILDRAKAVISWFKGFASAVVGWVGDTVSTLFTTGYNFIVGLWTGIQDRITGVTNWFKTLGSKIVGWVGDTAGTLLSAGKDIIVGLWNGIYDKATNWLKGKLGWLTDLLPGWVKSALGISSPSKVFAEIGVNMVDGLGLGVLSQENAIKSTVVGLADSMVDNFNPDKNEMSRKFNDSLIYIASTLENMDSFNPIITPVLDLSNIQRDSRYLTSFFDSPQIRSDLSYSGAQTIAAAEEQRVADSAIQTQSGDINFNQTINAPTALSTNDIYRQTRSQIALAKKELSLL